MTKAAVSGYYGFKNFGDETILSVLIEHLKTQNIDITVFSSDTEYTRNTYKVNSVYTFDIKKVINTIKSSDILISDGGSLLQDVTGIKSLLYYAFVIYMAILFNKKVIIFAQGIGPLNNKISQIIVKNLFKKCDYISVRDEKSFGLLKNWNIEADLVSDPVFSLHVEKSVTQNTLGIQLRDFKNINRDFLNQLAKFVNIKFSNYEIKLFSLQQKYDFNITKEFEQILKNENNNIKTEIITQNIAQNISKLEYFIAMRFHAVLVGLKAGVKTCAINYDIKVEQLAHSANIPLINPEDSIDIEMLYSNLTNLSSSNLIEFSDYKKFDWSKFDNIINHPVS